MCANILKEIIQFLYIAKNTCTFSFCCNCSGWTTCIQVYFPITEIGQHFSRPQEMIFIFCQYLRNTGNTWMILRQNITLFSSCQYQIFCWTDKRDIVSLYPWETFMMNSSKDCVSNPLHRSQINRNHISTPYSSNI